MWQVGSFPLPHCGEDPKPFCIDDCVRRRSRTDRILNYKYTTQISQSFERNNTLERSFRHSVHFNFPACPVLLLPFTGARTLLFLRNQSLPKTGFAHHLLGLVAFWSLVN